MKKIVVDSSVIVKWVVHEFEEYLDKADMLLSDAQSGKIDIFTPELAKYEIGNAIWKRKNISEESARILFSSLYVLPIHFVQDSKQLAIPAHAFAKKMKISYYDASFISLALTLDKILITDNIKHQKKIPGGKVIELRNYS